MIALLCGALVGLILGLVGGGGSILAVPLMVYVVGVKDPHVAIGTSALAVAVNALTGLYHHARAGSVVWRCGVAFAAAGVAGAALGSTLGKEVDGQRLLLLFALLMLVVGGLMFRHRRMVGDENVVCARERLPKVLGYGGLTGMFAGFFGIGGGFLVVPGLVRSTGMTMLNAVGTSLVAVAAFGFTTAANYALNGLVDWRLSGLFIVGGVAGGQLGAVLARRLASQRGALSTLFAGAIFVVAFYMIWRSVGALHL
ncbi:sulfite exporter TauE/SafE family protein [Acidocella sp.]|uniref:sulfite exporter TauE/SafE family protein n=1 Tax=Acidocella sp. TaxID=50710 RepID=UPI0026093789|nr:sulfite exporter TauE/SafE family protein [Acidocella sp.]